MLQQGPYRSEWPVLSHSAMVTSKLFLQLKAMSRSMTLPQSGSVLKYVTPDTIKDHATAKDLGCHLGLCCPATGGDGNIRAWEAAKDHVWIHGAIKARVSVGFCGLFHHQRTHRYLIFRTKPVAMFIPEGHADLSGLCYHLGPWVKAASRGHTWAHQQLGY